MIVVEICRSKYAYIMNDTSETNKKIRFESVSYFSKIFPWNREFKKELENCTKEFVSLFF